MGKELLMFVQKGENSIEARFGWFSFSIWLYDMCFFSLTKMT